MKTANKKTRKTGIEQLLKDIAGSARRKAFRHNRPVAVSLNGRPFLVYPDGSQKAVTPQLLQELRNGTA